MPKAPKRRPSNLQQLAQDLSLTRNKKAQQLLARLEVEKEAIEARKIAKEEDLGPFARLRLHTTVPDRDKDAQESVSAPGQERIAPITDAVHFSVTAPGVIFPGTSFLLDVWGHLDRDRSKLLRRAREEAAKRKREFVIQGKGPVPIRRGTTLQVRLDIPSLEMSDVDSLFWNGQLSNTSFLVATPSDASPGEHFGTVRFYVEQLVGRLYFSLQVGEFESGVEDRTTSEQRLDSAFASYASEDRSAVLARIQGMQKACPWMKVFMDVMSLRSGDDWEKRIEEEILARDIFYLFWSSAASQSPWVEHEWRIALDRKGIDSIDSCFTNFRLLF